MSSLRRPDAPAPGMSGGRPAGPSETDHVEEPGAHPVVPLLAGVGLLVVCLLLLGQVRAINAEGFSPQGPRFFPLVVVSLLGLLSVAYVGQQLRALRRRSGRLPAERFAHMPAAAVLLALLVAYGFALPTLGYAVATTGFFVGTARTLGSRHLNRDVVVGAGLSLGVYLAFTRLLGVYLPQGVFFL